MNAEQMLASPRKAYVLLNAEPELDMHDPVQAIRAMHAADMVVALSAYKHHAAEYADVLLPIAPFTETSGTFVNSEGRAQSFRGAVKPLGEARPAWKVLRVLGNLLKSPASTMTPAKRCATRYCGSGHGHRRKAEKSLQALNSDLSHPSSGIAARKRCADLFCRCGGAPRGCIAKDP